MYFPSIVGSLGLINQLSVPLNTEFIVGGFYTPGDGGGGTFIWISPRPSGFAPDGGITFDAVNTQTPSGYFRRIYSGPINVRWFGAIMGAIVGGSPITDVTPYVQDAMNAAAAFGGTIYFPTGTYGGHFVIDTSDNVSIEGDGQGTILTGVLDPVTGLSVYPEVILIKQHYGFIVRISNVQIYGGNNPRTYNGISFDPNDENAGGTFFENITLVQLLKGVYKPTGNIKNTFINCLFSENDIGYYARNSTTALMHSGADEIIKGEFRAHESAAIFVTSHEGYGQLIIEGTVIENNYGFGIMAIMSGTARMLGNAISIRNV